ncbi:MAG: molybdopterin molybdotransferase MoeA [Flavobacteriales bacterium]|nr:molybdopterin molybdotransferase MoeA [Flavobacteriales bacterium]
MITVEEARRIIMAHVPSMPAEFRPLELVVGAYAAADAFAADDYPRFDVSAVDGYAISDGPGPWAEVGRIAAGQLLGKALRAGECARIFTGAAVPEGAVAVLMQEHVIANDGQVVAHQPEVKVGANIRTRGESFRNGELLLAKGLQITPAHVGVLASGGVQELMVSLEPQVGIVRTGDEFIDDVLSDAGRIHGSNERMLVAAARAAHLYTDDVPYIAGDDSEILSSVLRQAADENDIIITTGGVSVGDHDLVRQVLEKLGATIHFHGVKQKPGKPMLFATLGRRPVFGLPGNPRAVLMAWHAYVLPFLRAMQGATDPWPRTERLPFAQAIQLSNPRAEFRAAQVRNGLVHLLPDEGSHMLTTMAIADALAYFPIDASANDARQDVEVIYLPRP